MFTQPSAVVCNRYDKNYIDFSSLPQHLGIPELVGPSFLHKRAEYQVGFEMAYDWGRFVLPEIGHPSRVSNRSQQAILEFNKRHKILYTSVKREIFLTQLLGNASQCDPSTSLLWTAEEETDCETWSGAQYLMPTEAKDDYFLQFAWRVPGIIYGFNPESALACGTNILLRDILGSNNPQVWRNFTDKYLGFIRGFQSRWFPYILLACGSGSTNPLLPMEIRVGSYMHIICCYLESMAVTETDAPPSSPMITGQMAESLCVPLTSEGDSYVNPSEKTQKLMEKQEKRSNQPGYWTDLLCHFRCIVCGQLKEPSQVKGEGNCTDRCLRKATTAKCSLCNMVMIGRRQMILHFTTLCKRPVADTCPLCAGKPMLGSCQCQLAMSSVHGVLKNIINDERNTLFKVPNVKLLSAICYHHYTGNLTYTPVDTKDRDYSWWQVDRVGTKDHIYTIKEEDVDLILQNLPTLSHDQQSVEFPGTNKVVSVLDLLATPEHENGEPSRTPKKVPNWMGGEESEQSEANSLSTGHQSMAWDNMKNDQEKKEESKEEKKEEKKENERRERKDSKRSENERQREEDHGESGDETSSDEEENDLLSGEHPVKKREDVKCRNETHKQPKLFRSPVEKLRHVILKHKCPFSPQGCKYYNEFEYNIKTHIDSTHGEENKIECDVKGCKERFTTKLLLSHHMPIHPKCGSCLRHFFDAQALKDHHPCFNVHAEQYKGRREAGGTHLPSVPTNEVDLFRQAGNRDPNVQLADSMAQLCQMIPMDEGTKCTLIENFRKCAAMQVAQSNLERFPSSSRKMTRLLIEPPVFPDSPNQKENLGKVHDFLGKELDVWTPSNSPKAQFKNFISLSELNEKMVAAVAACKLYESSACCLLLQRFSSSAKSAIESRCFCPPSTLSYRQLLMSCQEIYFYLNLEEVAIEAEESRKKDSEHMTEYASRAYKLLNTASLGRGVEEKEKYISSNLRRLVFRALPPKIRTKVENLELRFGMNYDSKDLLDFYKAEQLEQSHLRGDSLADTALIEPKKVLFMKKNKFKQSGKEKRTTEAGSEASGEEKIKKNRDRKIRSVVQGTKLGAVGHLLPDKADPPVVTPKPPYPVQGMAQGARDLFTQAARGSKAEYIRNKKLALGLDPEDRTVFCFKCGATGEEYHSQNKCKLPNTDTVHNCNGTTRLFHKAGDCPKRNQSLRSVRITREPSFPNN